MNLIPGQSAKAFQANAVTASPTWYDYTTGAAPGKTAVLDAGRSEAHQNGRSATRCHEDMLKTTRVWAEENTWHFSRKKHTPSVTLRLR